MIVLLPVAILVVHQIGDFRPPSRFLSFFAKLLLVANFIALLLMGLFISSYQVSLGHASADVVEYINEHDLSSGIEYEPKSHAYYLFDDQELYPFEDTSLALRNYSRPYFTGPVSMLDSSEYEVVHSAEVASFGVRLKELAVAKRISPHK